MVCHQTLDRYQARRQRVLHMEVHGVAHLQAYRLANTGHELLGRGPVPSVDVQKNAIYVLELWAPPSPPQQTARMINRQRLQ